MKNKISKVLFLLILLIFLGGFVSAADDANDTNFVKDSDMSYKPLNNVTSDYTTYKKESVAGDHIATEIEVNPIDDVSYSENATITGKYNTNTGKTLPNSKLIMDINGIKRNIQTDNNGRFAFNIKAYNVGVNNVTVSNVADSTYLASKTTSTFNVIAQDTEIYLDEVPNTQYSDIISIRGKYLDKNGVRLKQTNILIDINNNRYCSKTDGSGVFVLNYKTRSVGTNNVSISYPGNLRYNGDSCNCTFNVTPKLTVITIDDVKQVQYSDNVNVTGNYRDTSGNVLRYTPLLLKVNNKEYAATTDDNGIYCFNIKTTKAGKNTLTISYRGNARYNATTTEKSFNVSRKDTVFTINAIGDTEYSDNVTITGKYMDSSGNNLRYTPIRLSVNNKEYTATTNDVGVYTFKVKASQMGINEVTVSYPGNARYNEASKTGTFNVVTKSIKITVNTEIDNNKLSVNGRFTDTNANNLRYTPLIMEITCSNCYVNNSRVVNTKVTTDANGIFKFDCKLDDFGTYAIKVTYYGNTRYSANTTESTFIKKGDSHIYLNSLQARVNENKVIQVNVTDELNNSVSEGKLSLYVNNKLVQTVNKVSDVNRMTIPGQSIGIYDLKVVYTSKYYMDNTKTVKLSVNPVSDYNIKLLYSPGIIQNRITKISGHIRNSNNKTVTVGTVKFYLDNKYLGSSGMKNNLSYVKFNVTNNPGYYPVKIEYYINNKFIGAASDIVCVRPEEPQITQNTFIDMASDLVNNKLITSNKRDVYFAMDRTTHLKKDYSPNDMKIMNTIAYNLKMNGFNVKTIKNGPGETYNTALYMYNHNIRNSICFILCNGVDANVIREYLKGSDNRITAIRNRGNDIVLGWFYGAGNIYDSDAEYYYYLEKAWDDNYSGKGGIANPRRTMERDGIKIIYEREDLIGTDVANSFIKLYGGKVTTSVSKGSSVSLKTTVYNTGSTISSGNIVYTLNNKIIKNVTLTGNTYTFKYAMPNIKGTYNLKATYYSGNNLICQTGDRYIKVI